MTFKFDRLIQKYVDTGLEKGAKVHCTFTCARLHVKAANSIVTHTCIISSVLYVLTSLRYISLSDIYCWRSMTTIVDPLSALLITVLVLSDRFFIACLSALEILSTLSCCRLLVQNNSSLTLSRYICKLFPVRILASAIGLYFLNFLMEFLWSINSGGIFGMSMLLDRVTLSIPTLVPLEC